MGLTTDDLVAIEQLAARYNHAVDAGDGEGYASTFTDDGVFDAGSMVIEGHEALAAFAPKFAARSSTPRHVASNLVIDGDGDRATLRAYLQMYLVQGDPPRQELVLSGIYDDELAKVDGSWRFTRRRFVADV